MSRRLIQLASKGASPLCNVQQFYSVRSFRTSSLALAKAAKQQPKATKSFKQKTKTTAESAAAVSAAGKNNELFYKSAPIINMNEFLPELITDDALNKVFALPEDVTTSLEVFKYPKFLEKEFNLLNKASLVARQSSLDLVNKIDNATSASSESTRIILTGELGSGRSAVLLQAVSFALSRKWLVIYIPTASVYTNGSSSYAPIQGSNQFEQPALASSLLQKIKNVNDHILKEILLTKDYHIDRHSALKGTSLSKLLDIGIKDQYTAQKVFEVLLEEAGNTSTPTLLAVDEINALYTKTAYHDTDSQVLDAHRLRLPRTILDYFAGNKQFKAGAVVGAMSDHLTNIKSFGLEVALGLQVPDAYSQLPTETIALAKGVERLDIKPYTDAEAKTVLDYYHMAQVVFEEPSEMLLKKKMVTSNGNPRKFFNACVRNL
ncbi:hypothetical protein K450DRAFT_229100 [Umbelopsis ramanniana AG]|uniref:Small ribosomal subunit protein mS29 n=1 Tax=Umbelopsis ramanniana AG TaxID=1314678 RepID=A0AAD5HGH3_UMBRA|nr:uncharacterized protein K450DRAFT_229100 [Umbelopsis ramanniana AG]KAI8582119.1 hypothetical protein K450DRAFT_229100 [Umbelopsis ramanniana AG]